MNSFSIPFLILACWGFWQPSPVQAGSDCPATRLVVEGNSLAGLIFDGDQVSVYPIGCRNPQVGDLLVFKVKADKKRYIKHLWGKPGDSLAIIDGKFVEINGQRVLHPSGRAIRLNRLQSLVVGPLQGVLPAYFVIGVPGSLDSTQIGVIKQRFIVGSVPKSAIKDH